MTGGGEQIPSDSSGLWYIRTFSRLPRIAVLALAQRLEALPRDNILRIQTERGLKMFFSPHQIPLLHKHQTEVPMCLITHRIQPQDSCKFNLRSGKLFLRAKDQPKKVLRLFAIRLLIDCRLKMKENGGAGKPSMREHPPAARTGPPQHSRSPQAGSRLPASPK